MNAKNARTVEKYLAFIKEQPSSELEGYLMDKIYRNEDYLNDIIGTKYLTTLEWGKAIEYLSKVPLKFLDSQNICEYMATRSFTTEQWRKSQLKAHLLARNNCIEHVHILVACSHLNIYWFSIAWELISAHVEPVVRLRCRLSVVKIENDKLLIDSVAFADCGQSVCA